MSRWLPVALVVGALASPSVAAAQTVEFGIKGGLSFANIPQLAEFFEDQGADDVGSRTGAVFGAHVAFDLTDGIAIQPEVLFTQRGFQGEAPFDLGDFAAELDYLDIPVLVRLGAGDSGLTLVAGPSFNFNVRATGTAEDQDDEDLGDDIEDLDIGLVFGAGYYGTVLIIEGRFEEGLTKVATFSGSDTNRNRTFMVMAGVRFR
jgi:hypothetical protein